MRGNKLIFISDLHMNNHFSFSPSGNGYSCAYAWLNENIPTVAEFLTWLGERQDLNENRSRIYRKETHLS